MAKDIYHLLVRNALEKDGWLITHDPYVLKRLGKRSREVDLGAEKFIAAERGKEKIAIEVKSFLGSSFVYEFNTAFGQYSIYKFFLHQTEPDRNLFLAIPKFIFEKEFSVPDITEICNEFKIQILVFDVDNEMIVKWIGR
jgi:hypothetical protein